MVYSCYLNIIRDILILNLIIFLKKNMYVCFRMYLIFRNNYLSFTTIFLISKENAIKIYKKLFIHGIHSLRFILKFY